MSGPLRYVVVTQPSDEPLYDWSSRWVSSVPLSESHIDAFAIGSCWIAVGEVEAEPEPEPLGGGAELVPRPPSWNAATAPITIPTPRITAITLRGARPIPPPPPGVANCPPAGGA